MYMICDNCHDEMACKVIVIAVRTQTTEDNDLSAERIEFKSVPMCKECIKARKAASQVLLTSVHAQDMQGEVSLELPGTNQADEQGMAGKEP